MGKCLRNVRATFSRLTTSGALDRTATVAS